MITRQTLPAFVCALFMPAVGACDRPGSFAPAQDVLSPAGVLEASGGAAAPRPFGLAATGSLVDQQLAPGFPPGASDFGGRCSAPSHFVIKFAIEGTATGLGHVTGELEHCTRINFQTGAPSFIDGTVRLIAANGDRLDGTYAGHGLPGGGFRDDLRFSGGTGRFASALGHAISTGMCDQATGKCRLDMRGSLSYAASDRSNIGE